ncbi:unnamed protein product (macronuclear) [Paramecium tetraurelia]|uniref:Uncharacterized protein n=1 Tax=Paramecium tetraurelia TaxID=5888 RepID=A0D6W2_PARTE|nr:uncharacterized protein GSPATT00001820001 [Paramecium tetraurelia]CAK78779.1 unnamed protein product [Paramecium tetraurelia]|eukprot:XP_001446176.1 hypothetical protein (macronuclear) [Paramecium tetraurelia strain d4-2]
MQFVNCTPSPRKSPITMQGKQGKTYKQKKSMKSTSKQLEIPPISTQRTMKTTDQILSQRSPITGTTKTTKYTIETKRSMSPEELKSFRKSNKTQKNQEDTNNPKQRSPLSTEKKQHSKKMSIQQYMKDKKKSEQLKEKLLQQKVLNEQQKKLCNLQKLQLETKQIIQNAKKIKKKSSKKRMKCKKQILDQIIKRFEEISKRYEKVQLDQIDKFQQEVAKHQQSYKTQTEIESQINYNQEDFDAFNEYYLHQAALLIQIHWKEHKKRKNQQNKKASQSKLQQISIDWEPQQLVSQQTSPSNFEDGFLFCQGGEKQVHISNIRSSIISEESSPIVSQLNQEFENWNLFTQRIVKNKDISSINKQMQQQIISIVQTHLKKSENISERRSENEVLQEKSINKHQKQLSEDLSKFNVLQLQKQSQEEENLVLNYREEVLYLRYDVEQKNTTGKDHQLLEEWLNRELEDLQNTRKAFEIGHRREISTLKKIQRDILIASAELQSDPQDNLQIQQIQQQIDEQFNGLKVTRQNNNKLQEEIHQTVDLVTTEILNDVMMELTEEVLNKREDLYLLISNLVVNQDEPPCVPTSMVDISQYIDNLFKYIMENYQQSLISNLSAPFGFTPKQRLRLIHGNEDDDIDNNKELQDQIAFPIDEAIFVEYENQRMPATDNDDEIGCAILELQHIHNKAIFDACNEVLNRFRPFYYNSGIKYPWEQKRNSLEKILNTSLVHIMEEVKSTVLKQSKVLCGFYPTEDFEIIKQEKQEIIDEKNILMLMQQLNLVENPLLIDTNIQFDNLALIRDEQLYKLLIEDIKEQEYKWTLIEDDRAEYLMELSDQILENLIEEVSKEM